MNILVTGSAGFIGHHLARRLVLDNFVVGIDNLNDYYSVKLKEKRNSLLSQESNYKFINQDICDLEGIKKIILDNKIDIIIHLAAQAGVRHSIENPFAYEKSNMLGTLNILEAARTLGVKKIIMASSSSVYGNSKKTPFSEEDVVNSPVSLYAATKLSVEQMSYTYSHLYGIDIICFRFFTVYGPLCRPDMAPMKFSLKILKNETIEVYNHGELQRDFTYIDDIVEGIVLGISYETKFDIFNLGNDNPVKLMDFISELEKNLGKAKLEYKGMQPGDVYITYADLTKSRKLLGYNPKTSFSEGILKMCNWIKENKDFLINM
jgi:UDP-glucuronate 4-epimerase